MLDFPHVPTKTTSELVQRNPFPKSVTPFGGFFASGLKRAAQVKDFGDVIPGHGGLTDRFDCGMLM